MSKWEITGAGEKLKFGSKGFFIYTGGLYGGLRKRVDGYASVSQELPERFKDWTRPTEFEATLFELEFGIPYVPQHLLDEVRREYE